MPTQAEIEAAIAAMPSLALSDSEKAELLADMSAVVEKMQTRPDQIAQQLADLIADRVIRLVIKTAFAPDAALGKEIRKAIQAVELDEKSECVSKVELRHGIRYRGHSRSNPK